MRITREKIKFFSIDLFICQMDFSHYYIFILCKDPFLDLSNKYEEHFEICNRAFGRRKWDFISTLQQARSW